MPTKVNASYTSPEDVERLLDIRDTDDRERLRAAITAASRTVDAICRRPGIGGAVGGFYNIAAATATFRPPEGWEPADIGDWAAVGTAQISNDGGVTWDSLTAADYQLEPLNAALVGRSYTAIRRHLVAWPADRLYYGRPCLRIIGTYGWASVPDEVEQATRLLTVRWWKRKDSPLGVQGFADMPAMYVRGSDPDVERLLAPFMCWAAG